MDCIKICLQTQTFIIFFSAFTVKLLVFALFKCFILQNPHLFLTLVLSELADAANDFVF